MFNSIKIDIYIYVRSSQSRDSPMYLLTYFSKQKKRNFLQNARLWEQNTVPYEVQSGCKYFLHTTF